MKKLEVKVTKVLYYNNGWGIFGCIPIDKYAEQVEINSYGNFSIKGKTFELIKDNTYTIEIKDEIERSPKGDSYNIIKVYIPSETNSNSQYNFLKSVTTEKQYENIIKVFPPNNKLKIIDAIKNGEIDLTKVKNIGEKNVNSIKKKIVAKEEFMQVYSRLLPLGVTEGMVEKIIAHYKFPQTVIDKVDESMYNLCEVKGLGFKTVDEYAIADGERPDSFKRIEACVNYLVHEFAQEGHSWTSIEDMKTKAVELLEIEEYHLDVFLGSLDLMDEKETNLRNVHDGQITNKYYYEVEQDLYNHLSRINNNYKIKIDEEKMEKALISAQESLELVYTEEQRDTVLESFKHGVYIINGKGGTGKSTIMKGITEICGALGMSYQAIALSGRAAQLLTLKGIESSTIHRLLGVSNKGFKYNEENHIPLNVVIIEEASMANAYLIRAVACAMSNGSKLIIVGDSGQLSAIGNGDVLRDLIDNPKFAQKELEQIHRQAQDSGIIEIAGQIREGQNVTGYNSTISNKFGKNEDLYIFTYNDKELMYQNTKEVVRKQMVKLDEQSILDFQILVANKSRGEFSTVTINKYCQSIYNDLDKPSIKNHTHEFRVGDKVIVNGNKYEIPTVFDIETYEAMIDSYSEGDSTQKVSLFNGTIGIIKYLDEDNDTLLVDFEGIEGLVLITKMELSDIDLAYAITVHKSQGMSISNVLFLLDYGAFKLLSKQLVYTAITRASKKCIVFAQNNALHQAINNDAGLRRTFVGQFIQMDN